MHVELDLRDFTGDIDAVIDQLVALREQGATRLEYVEDSHLESYVVAK